MYGKKKSSLYCKNTKDFSTSRLLLDTNSLTLVDNSISDSIKICLRDITAFRSSINILQVVEQVNEAVLEVDVVPENNEFFAKTIEYKN